MQIPEFAVVILKREKVNNPTIFKWNIDRIFPNGNLPVKKRKTRSVAEAEGTITSIVFGSSDVDEIAPNIDSDDTASITIPNVNDINSSANSTDTHTAKVNELKKGQNQFYLAENLNEEVLRMERGIPTKKLFFLIVAYVTRFKEDIAYFYG